MLTINHPDPFPHYLPRPSRLGINQHPAPATAEFLLVARAEGHTALVRVGRQRVRRWDGSATVALTAVLDTRHSEASARTLVHAAVRRDALARPREALEQARACTVDVAALQRQLPAGLRHHRHHVRVVLVHAEAAATTARLA